MQAGSERVSDIITRIGSALSKLTVLRSALGTPPFRALRGLVSAAAEGDLNRAAECASELTAALISCGARRVSGDLMMDLVIDTVLMSENPFAVSAAGGRMDDAVSSRCGGILRRCALFPSSMRTASIGS